MKRFTGNPFAESAVVSGYEAWYENTGRRADRLEKALLKQLLARFPQASSILEVGCGTGHFTRWFEELGLQTAGLDLSLSMLAEAIHITLFVFGGVAQIADEPPSAATECWIALAGPVVSLALAAFFALLQSVFASFVPLLALAGYLTYLNGTLALFNLIPGFPLDGGRVLQAILWGTTDNLRRATLIAASAGRGIAFLFIVLGVWQMIAGNVSAGLWIAFIGWFLESVAAAQIQQHVTQGL
jgi:Zn-dependent protease